MVFSAYHYAYMNGKNNDKDDTSVHKEIDVTGQITSWTYVYMAYDVSEREARIFLMSSKKGNRDFRVKTNFNCF